MSRIQPLQIEDLPELAGVFKAGERIMGFIPNDGLIMAHQPAVLKAFLGLVQAVYEPGKVSGGLKRLMGLLASTVSGCLYCQAHASNAAQQQDVEAQKINAVWEFESSQLFSVAERSALRFALHASMIPNATTDEDFVALKQYYSDPEIIEMLSVISMYAFLNRWNSTLQTDLESYFSEST